MSKPHLYVFAKDPDAVPVKTRLAAGLGAAGATRFYRECLRLFLGDLARLGEQVNPTVLVTPGASAGDFGRRFGWPHRVAPQAEGDLGQRLLAAFTDAGGPAMVVGSDMPELGAAGIQAACAAMAPGRVVLGPCPDGGYYLLGAPGPEPRLFEAMPWSTPGLAEATRARARQLGLELVELDPVADIDHLEDLEALETRCAGRGPLGRLVRSLLA